MITVLLFTRQQLVILQLLARLPARIALGSSVWSKVTGFRRPSPAPGLSWFPAPHHLRLGGQLALCWCLAGLTGALTTLNVLGHKVSPLRVMETACPAAWRTAAVLTGRWAAGGGVSVPGPNGSPSPSLCPHATLSEERGAIETAPSRAPAPSQTSAQIGINSL